MSLYHETAEILLAAGTSGGSLRTLTYGKKGLKSPPAQVYALAVESARWSGVLKEVVEASEILKFERKVSGHAQIIGGGGDLPVLFSGLSLSLSLSLQDAPRTSRVLFDF